VIRRRPWLVLFVALALIQTLVLVHSAYALSNTNDEGVYIGRGAYQYNGAFSCTPALPEWGYALALRAVNSRLLEVNPPLDLPSDVEAQPASDLMLFEQPFAEFRRDLLAGRFATIFVTVAAGWFLWTTGRRFGPAVGALAHAFWCFSPLVLASGALATLDGWSAATMCVLLWTTVRLVERATWQRAVAVGGALALGAACKFTLLLAAPVLAGVVLFALAGGGLVPTLRRAVPVAAGAVGGFLLVLWALYGFSLARLGVDGMCPRASTLSGLPRMMLPFPEFLEGVLMQLRHGFEAGHANYLFGEVSARGWWWFYLAALALQTTLAAQALALARVVAFIHRRPSRASLLIDGALLAFPLLLFVVLSRGKTQNGLKYLLPIYPCLMLCGARLLVDLERVLAGTRLALARRLTTAMVGLGALSALVVHPHYLMFFNAWAGGPAGGWRYLIHGNDWGQDVGRLAEWQRAQHVERLYFLPYVEGATLWGVRYAIPPCEPKPGVYALHAIHTHRPYEMWRGCWDWLTVEPPDERVGYTIYVYRVDAARIERLRQKRGHVAPFVRTGGS
jgi:hypothetical protein